MEYFDAQTNEKYMPFIIESTYGLDRLVLAVLFEALEEEELENGETREVLKINPLLSPVKVNILPLVKKRHADKAKLVYSELTKHFMVSYDDSGNIGRRYRRGDAIGTPFAVTVDDVTLESGTVTVRERDTMQQVVVDVDKLKYYLADNIKV
jgi:glycyl-tRNA synthetase